MNTHSTVLAAEASEFYSFANPTPVFIRHNENITYLVEDGTKKYLLRIHEEAEGLDFSFFRGGLPREALVASETDLLNGLQKSSGLLLQQPIRNKGGQYLTRLTGGAIVTVLSWLNGETLAGKEMTQPLAYKIGQMTATLHQSTRALPCLNRCRCDDTFADAFLSELKSAEEMQHLDFRLCGKLETILAETKSLSWSAKDDFSLVHLDLGEKNMVYDGKTISPIDFSMSGYGMPEMDIADLFVMMRGDRLRSSLLSGYASVAENKLDREHLKILEAFSLIQYILIHHRKLHKDEKFISRVARWTPAVFDPLLLQIRER